MRFTVVIHSNDEGSALVGPGGGQEIARILRDTADEIEKYGTGRLHHDDRALLLVGGKRVGEWALEAGS